MRFACKSCAQKNTPPLTATLVRVNQLSPRNTTTGKREMLVQIFPPSWHGFRFGSSSGEKAASLSLGSIETRVCRRNGNLQTSAAVQVNTCGPGHCWRGRIRWHWELCKCGKFCNRQQQCRSRYFQCLTVGWHAVHCTAVLCQIHEITTNFQHVESAVGYWVGISSNEETKNDCFAAIGQFPRLSTRIQFQGTADEFLSVSSRVHQVVLLRIQCRCHGSNQHGWSQVVCDQQVYTCLAHNFCRSVEVLRLSSCLPHLEWQKLAVRHTKEHNNTVKRPAVLLSSSKNVTLSKATFTRHALLVCIFFTLMSATLFRGAHIQLFCLSEFIPRQENNSISSKIYRSACRRTFPSIVTAASRSAGQICIQTRSLTLC